MCHYFSEQWSPIVCQNIKYMSIFVWILPDRMFVLSLQYMVRYNEHLNGASHTQMP